MDHAQEGAGARDPHVNATADELSVLMGPHDANRKLIEEALDVRVQVSRGGLVLEGAGMEPAVALVEGLLEVVRAGRGLSTADVRYALRQAKRNGAGDVGALLSSQIVVTQRGRPVAAKTPGQRAYVQAMVAHDLTFCIGPAGTGKTYLAMAMAVAALRDSQVARIILTRPIVEAGEALGFLPGDIMEKVDPYLRPLQDALHDIMGADRFRRAVERGTIEVIPLAYMRGRTLNDAFIVLDEAQNATPGQVKMALTRLGFGSKMVVTGDPTQVDLPQGQVCGLKHAMQVLEGVGGVGRVELTAEDIVRHDLVQRIVAAYDSHARMAASRHEKTDS